MTTSTFYIAAAYGVTLALLGGLGGYAWYRSRALKSRIDDHGDPQ